MTDMEQKEFETRYLSALNPQQKAAVTAVDGPVLVLATPGSGKTTVLVLRLGYMVLCRGVDPCRILTMTYTRAATRDMRDRFASFFGRELADALPFRTINGVSARIIGMAGRLYGREPFALLDDEGERGRILRDVWLAVTFGYPDDSDIRDLGTAITYIKNMLLSDEEIEKLDRGVERLPELYRAYQAELRKRRAMDFDDQMVYALTLLRRFPDLLSRIQNQYRYCCVDEAQDTSRVQHEIIRLLASRDQNLFMVGDEDQSIYSFRAAYPEALLHFSETYADARILKIEENYRSTPEIVAAANRFIQKNRNRLPKTMVATREAGREVSFVTVSNRRGQYEWLLKHAADMPPGSAVLFRNNDSLLPLADGLSAAGIPFACRNYEDSFFTSRVVLDVLDIIRFSEDPTNAELFRRLYYRLGLGVTKPEAEQALQNVRRGENLFAALANLRSLSAGKRAGVQQLLINLDRLQRDDAFSAVTRIFEDMRYGQYVRRNGLEPGKQFILGLLARGLPSAGALLTHLEELRTLVAEKAPASQAGAGPYSAPASQAGAARGARNGAGSPAAAGATPGLILSTIHSSKGLEYDRVYLLDMLDGVLPSIPEGGLNSPEDRAEYEEERRLFYVAMTRAKDELFLFLTPEPAPFPREVLHDMPGSRAVELRSRLRLEATRKAERRTAAGSSGSGGRGKFPLGSGSASGASEKPCMTPEEFLASHGPGSAVEHKTFGRGVVEAVGGDIITVHFDAVGTKKLVLSAALEKGLLKAAE